MAETATATPKSKTAPDASTSDAGAGEAPVPAPPGKGGQPPPIALRVALGFAGLTLLVGFFLPWLRTPAASEGGAETVASGLTLMTSGDVAGTPSMLLLLVPALGAALSATAFMGFRWSGQVAVGVAVALIGYALYVLLQMFVQHTGMGLWIEAGGTLIILLLGVITWMLGREKKAPKDETAEGEPAEAAPAAAARASSPKAR